MSRSDDSIDSTLERILDDCLRYAAIAARPKSFSEDAQRDLRGPAYFGGSFRRVLQDNRNAYDSESAQNFLHKWSLLLGIYAKDAAGGRDEIDSIEAGQAIQKVVNEVGPKIEGTWCDFDQG